MHLTSRRPRLAILALFVASALTLAQRALGAETAPADASADIDPTKLVFFNARFQHDQLLDGNTVDFLLLRRDIAIPRPRAWGPGERLALLRFDFPVGTVHAGGESKAGVGDLFAQALNVHVFSPTFSLAAGLAFVLPTASADLLGAGKWQVAPTVIPVWRVPQLRGLVFVRLQDYVSFAGDSQRRDVHALTVNASYLRFLSPRRFLLLDTEVLADWQRDGASSFRSGILIGGFLSHRRALWVKAEVPWGENRRGDWTLKASIAFRRRE